MRNDGKEEKNIGGILKPREEIDKLLAKRKLRN
jgi:hypothetical protein